MADIKETLKTGNADKIVGGATVVMALYGAVSLGRKVVNTVGNGVDKVFPKKEREVTVVDVPKEEVEK